MARLVPKIYPADYDEATAIGLTFPLTVGNALQNFTTTKQVHDNLRNLILTIPGERVYYPTFGSGLHHVLFETAAEEDMEIAAESAIEDAVEEWMPFVTLTTVKAEFRPDEQLIIIKIEYRINGWAAENVLNLEVNI